MSQFSTGNHGGMEPGGSADAAGELLSLIESRLDRKRFQDQHWSGTFWDYLAIIDRDPGVLRNAYQ
ncbi:MAG: hypothetical protein R3B68_17060, partial [Phycisphaerales bacterium]